MNYKLVAIIIAFLVGLYFCLTYKSKDVLENFQGLGQCPNLLVKNGSFNRSIIGAHKKLNAYTPKISPAQPIVLLLRPSSFNHRESALAINTQGKPLIIPKRRIRIILLS